MSIVNEGKEGCQCIDSRNTLESLVDISCLTSEGQGGVMLSAQGPCVPYSYGSGSCLRHDFIHDPKCQLLLSNSSQTEYPDYCIRSWCYVEAKECMLSDERVYSSNIFPSDEGVNLVRLLSQFLWRAIICHTPQFICYFFIQFYSYTTCHLSEDDWIQYQQQNTLGGITMIATVPKYYKSPFMYRSNSSGEIIKSAGDEYYDNRWVQKQLQSDLHNFPVPLLINMH